jgi:plasmid stability protein
MQSLTALRGDHVAVLTIRNIDDTIKADLRVRAAQHGCSMEEEARRILAQALQGAQAGLPLGTRLRQHFAGVGEIAIPPRRPARAAPDFLSRAAKAK